jgi:hypothetical protein
MDMNVNILMSCEFRVVLSSKNGEGKPNVDLISKGWSEIMELRRQEVAENMASGDLEGLWGPKYYSSERPTIGDYREGEKNGRRLQIRKLGLVIVVPSGQYCGGCKFGSKYIIIF